MEEVIQQAITSELGAALNKEAGPHLSRLKEIIKEINKHIEILRSSNISTLVEHTNREKAGRLLKHLDEKYVSVYTTELKQDTRKQQIVIDSITKLYFLTEEFFVLKGAISKPKFTMTYSDSQSGMYYRQEFEIGVGDLKVNEDSHQKIQLRFQTQSVLEKMKAVIKDNEIEQENAKKLYKHFMTFTEPYQEYKRAGNYSGRGIWREAFELHLENLHKSYVYGTEKEFNPNCQMESVAHRWVLYKYASGNDPYFTGPDTALSQVKAENASLITDIDTVLNAAAYIVKWGEEVSTTDLSQMLKTKGANEINTFAKNIWETLSKEIQDEIVAIMGSNLGLSSPKVVIREKDIVIR